MFRHPHRLLPGRVWTMSTTPRPEVPITLRWWRIQLEPAVKTCRIDRSPRLARCLLASTIGRVISGAAGALAVVEDFDHILGSVHAHRYPGLRTSNRFPCKRTRRHRRMTSPLHPCQSRSRRPATLPPEAPPRPKPPITGTSAQSGRSGRGRNAATARARCERRRGCAPLAPRGTGCLAVQARQAPRLTFATIGGDINLMRLHI
jgi:hypothetical protein